MTPAGGRARPSACPRWAALLLLVLALLLVPPVAASAAPPRLTVRSAILYVPSTGQTLFADRARDELAIASTTKLMTALLTLDHVRHLGTMFTQNNYYPASVDSQIGLVPGERMSVHDLLIALMLPSADDAAEDLAYNVGHHSVARFVAMMNAKAAQLGLTGTHYSTPSGLDTPGNHSTAADLVRLAAYDQAHSRFFARIVGLGHAELRTGNHLRQVINLNTLVRDYAWIDGVKTGHTAAAGYVLVASGHRYGMKMLSAVLGTTSQSARDANSLALLDYGFGHFRLRTPVIAGAVLARPAVRDQPGRHVALLAERGLSRVVALTDALAVRIDAPRRVVGPLRRHAVLGTAIVLVAGRPVIRIPLLLAQALPAPVPASLSALLIGLLLLFGAFVVALALALSTRQQRRERAAGRGLEAA